MHCPNCRNWTPDNARFCHSCGSAFAQQPLPVRQGNGLAWLLIALVILAAFIAVVVVFNNERQKQQEAEIRQQRERAEANAGPMTTLAETERQRRTETLRDTDAPKSNKIKDPKPTPNAGESTPLINDKIVLQPRYFRTEPFTVESMWEFGLVSGRFRAEGGSGNDIECYIFDGDGMENFKNGHNATTYYNSGKVTVGTINVRLHPGSYYLVFSNKDSIISNKVVTASVYLHKQ